MLNYGTEGSFQLLTEIYSLIDNKEKLITIDDVDKRLQKYISDVIAKQEHINNMIDRKRMDLFQKISDYIDDDDFIQNILYTKDHRDYIDICAERVSVNIKSLSLDTVKGHIENVIGKIISDYIQIFPENWYKVKYGKIYICPSEKICFQIKEFGAIPRFLNDNKIITGIDTIKRIYYAKVEEKSNVEGDQLYDISFNPYDNNNSGNKWDKIVFFIDLNKKVKILEKQIAIRKSLEKCNLEKISNIRTIDNFEIVFSKLL